MATFKVLAGTEKKDKTFPVMIQVYHNKDKKYINTGHYVTRKQLNRDFELKDEFVLQALNNTIVAYRERLLKLPNINVRSAQDIKDYLYSEIDNEEIDFIEYARKFIAKQALTTGKNSTTILRSLIEFLGIDRLPIRNISLKLLNDFALYLKTERYMERRNHTGTIRKKFPPMTDTGVRSYIGRLNQIFQAAMDDYNDDEKTVITNYPFRKFKMPKVSVAKKRNVDVEIVKAVRDMPDTLVRANLARDIFMLSFYLVGINPIDIYRLDGFKDGRLFYNRSKTKGRKKDQAFISIKVEPEVLPLIEKYKDHTGKRIFNFYHLYGTNTGFNSALHYGFKTLHENTGIKVTAYYARHSWATIGRNICRISKDDIAFALNHSDPTKKVTDLYIEEDFSIIDEANRKVLDTLL